MRGNEFLEKMELADAAFIEEADRQPENKKRSWVKWGGIAACLALVVIAAFALFPKDTQAPIQSGSSIELRVNALDEAPLMADADVIISNYDKLPYDVWQEIKEEFSSFTGMSYDAFAEKIPEPLREGMAFYSLSTRGYKDAELDADYRLHDYVFECNSADGVRVTIALCSFEAPVRDCFIADDAPEESNINGTTAIIYGYENIYWVQFSYKGVNYDIETVGMDLGGLEALLTSIIA